jgi:tartrate dehydrogenase/decarboxylase / D-malate dehydrogenase
MRLAVVPGDGIGPEVVRVTVPLLDTALRLDGVSLDIEELDWGGDLWHRTGAMIPPDAVEYIAGFDAVLFGAVGRLDIPAHESVWGLVLTLRRALDLYVNLRPVWHWPNLPVPVNNADGVDFVVIRENTEGEYSGVGGRSHAGTPSEVALDVAVHSRRAIERVAIYAFQLAEQRSKRVSLVTKSNVSRHGYALWDEVVSEVGGRYPNVDLEFVFVDAMAARMILNPQSLDVMLCSNLFGDILSDLGSVFQGGLGMAPSGNIHPERAAPGIFEPVHGSAPDIAGKGIANPVACILSAAMLARENECPRAARALNEAIGKTLGQAEARTRDLGGHASTADLAAAVAQQLAVIAEAAAVDERQPRQGM